MSYSISITGHKDGVENVEAFHDEILEKTQEFVKTLEGVTSAAMNGRSAMPESSE